MSNINLPQLWLGIEIGMQITRIILDVWREVKKEREEENKPNACQNCPLLTSEPHDFHCGSMAVKKLSGKYPPTE